MTVLFVLLPLAILTAGGFVVMFIWATRDGQFDDMRTPQVRVLFDDETLPEAGLGPVQQGEKERS